MIVREYKDFNEAFFELNKELLLKPKLFIYSTGAMSLIDGLYITTKSDNVSQIDIGALGYKKNKWGHLIRSYLGEEKVEELKTFSKDTKALTVAFDFRRKGEGNGSCLREIVLSREDRNKSFTTATILWRSVELQSKWGPDLILLNRMFQMMSNVEIKEFRLIFTQAHQNSKWVVPFITSVFGVEIEELDPNQAHTRSILSNINTAFSPENESYKNYAKLKKLKEIYETGETESVPLYTLRLEDFYD